MLRDRLVSAIIKVLTKPSQKGPTWPYNDLESLKRHIRKGDVLLVEGDQRVSEVIKYLTQSIWSHAALYIGDKLLREVHGYRTTVLRQFGEEAKYLVIEALLDEGVAASPLSKYIDSTIRVCRPHGLKPEALQTTLNTVIGHLGDQYDTKHIFDLARYFFPVNLIPRRFRKAALHLGSSVPTQVICSSLIAEAFQMVRFPILPERLSGEPLSDRRRLSLREAIFRQGRPEYAGIFRMPHPTLITARDFDLSPYFETIEFNLIEGAKFDYRRLIWADEQCPPTPQLPSPEPRKPDLPMRSIFHGPGAHRAWNQMNELVGGGMRLWGRCLMKSRRTVFSWTRRIRSSHTQRA
ncbi:MAG: lipo-like protein [Candidatus Methylomirabilis oxyfera]|nr:lipo-like protein [Candidatus Methylomirabilis oxyfera]